MVGHGGSSAGSYLADPTSPIPYHYASIVATSTVRVNNRNCTSQLPCKVSSVLIAEFVSHYTAIGGLFMHRANDFGGGFNPLMQCNPHVCFAIFG